MAQKTQSSNWVLKLNMHRMLFWSTSKQIGFELALKIIQLAIFIFYFKPLFTPPPPPPCADVKRPGTLPPNSSPWLYNRSTAKFTMPQNLYLHCRIILWSFFMKYDIQKLNLISKTDISKTAWINPWYGT